jgi:hypothetical protein
MPTIWDLMPARGCHKPRRIGGVAFYVGNDKVCSPIGVRPEFIAPVE